MRHKCSGSILADTSRLHADSTPFVSDKKIESLATERRFVNSNSSEK